MSIGIVKEYTLKLKNNHQLSIFIKFKDILKENCDILVNETISDCKLSKVNTKEGHAVLKDLYDEKIKRTLRRPLKEGQLALTSRGNFPNQNLKYILHLSPIIYQNKEKSNKLLKDNILRSLIVGEKEKINKITFPPLSCGMYGFPSAECAECFFEAIFEFHKKYHIDSLNNITIDLNDFQIFDDFENVFTLKKSIFDESVQNNQTIVINKETIIDNFIKFRDIEKKYRILSCFSLILSIVIAYHLAILLYDIIKIKFNINTTDIQMESLKKNNRDKTKKFQDEFKEIPRKKSVWRNK